jgi:hypothetical protein
MMKQGIDAAGETLKKAVAMPAGVAQKAMDAASQAATASAARKSAQAGPAPAGAAKKVPARKRSAAPAKPRAR